MTKLLRKFLKPFAALVLLGCICTFFQVFCDLKLPDLMSGIIDIGVIKGDVGYILSVGLGMLGWAMLSMVAVVIAAFCSARTAMGFGRDVRTAIYRHVSSFSLPELDAVGTSSLITRTTNDVQQLERFLQMGLTVALMSPIMFIGAVTMAFVKSSTLSTVVVVAIPILLVTVGLMIRFVTPLLRSLQARMDYLNRVTREGLTGIRVIRAYRKEAFEEKRFSDANRSLSETNVKVARRMGSLMPVVILIMNLVTIAIVWFGAQLVQTSGFEVGNLMAIIQYAMQILFSVMMLSMVFMLWPRAVAAAERIQEVLETKPTIVDAEGAKDNVAQLRFDAPHVLSFDHVSFSFPGAEEPSLRDVDLTLEAGKIYAIIGSTGSGKSTLINLIERFYEPSEGRILIDGLDIAKIPQTDLRRLIAYVPQKTVLFSGTIAENIRYGAPDADDEAVIAAAKAAQAYDFIMAKEDGFETRITQSGSGLSGGQAQRLSIARALVKASGLFIFDDSFSALDFKTDALVRSALARETRGATVLIVAQRVAAAMDADRVIVLDEGKVVGVGSHEDLVESCDVYREIALSQLDEEEVA